jgi:hypothetical protein
MIASIAFVVPWAALSQAVVQRCGIRQDSFVGGEIRQKSGRAGRQDKSRDVRLGRSGRWRFDFNTFDMHLAMCAGGSRCAATPDSLILLAQAHLAGDP